MGTRTALVNQLAPELAGFWPGPLGLFTTVHSQISLAFLSATPAPRTHAGWASSAFRRSWRASDIPAASTRAASAKLRRAPEARVGELELASAERRS